MSGGVNFRVVWDGDVPGLREHRLSLAEFSDSLVKLLRAVRNIAADLESSAGDEPSAPKRGTLKTLVDVQLTTLAKGSLDLLAEVVSTPRAAHVPELAKQVVSEWMSCVRAEAAGTRRNRYVNDFLHSLPDGLKRQRYAVLDDNGNELDHLEIGTMTLAEAVEPLPRMTRISGKVVGVGFESGRQEVKLAPFDGSTISMDADDRLVNEAIKLRSGPVDALVISEGKDHRLLWVRPINSARRFTEEEAEERIFTEWGEVLKRLSK